MPELADVPYSRDNCVAAVRSYYQFLTHVYLPACQIIEPPEGGWPSIVNADPRLLKSFGKTDEVISLLAHLPYLSNPGDFLNDAHGAGECILADWQLNFTGGHIDAYTSRIMSEKHFINDVPPHVVGLCFGDRENPVFLLDTKLGIVYWSECPDSITRFPTRERILDDPCDYASRDEWDWRCDCPAWAVADFFELFKDQFRLLSWIPISPRHVIKSEWYSEKGGQEPNIHADRHISRPWLARCGALPERYMFGGRKKGIGGELPTPGRRARGLRMSRPSCMPRSKTHFRISIACKKS